MAVVKIGKKGRLTIPSSVLSAAGIAEGSSVMLEITSEGAIVMRRAAVHPVELYTDERVHEFVETNTVPAAIERRVDAYLKNTRSKC